MAARPSPLPDWARKFRPPVDRTMLGLDAARPNRAAVVIGIVGSLLVNLVLFGAPRFLPDSNFTLQPAGTEPVVDHAHVREVILEPFLPPEQPRRVVRTNPNLPEQEPPPDTINESEKNSQAANEVTPIAPSPDDTPARRGEEDVESDHLVSGMPGEDAAPEVPAVPEVPENSAASEAALPAEEVAMLPSENSLTRGSSDDHGNAPDQVGTTRTPGEDPAGPNGGKTGAGTPGGTAVARAPTPPTPPPGATRESAPAPRPQVARPRMGNLTPVQQQLLGVSQTGTVEVSSRFSEYGEYINRLVDAVSQRWNSVCARQGFRERATHVRIEFRLSADGRVHGLRVLDRSSGIVGEFLCRTAIEECQPFAAWTSEMIQSLDLEEPIVLRFYYR